MEINIASGFMEEVYKNYIATCQLHENGPQMSYLEFKKIPIFYSPTTKRKRVVQQLR